MLPLSRLVPLIELATIRKVLILVSMIASLIVFRVLSTFSALPFVAIGAIARTIFAMIIWIIGRHVTFLFIAISSLVRWNDHIAPDVPIIVAWTKLAIATALLRVLIIDIGWLELVVIRGRVNLEMLILLIGIIRLFCSSTSLAGCVWIGISKRLLFDIFIRVIGLIVDHAIKCLDLLLIHF